MSFYDEMAEVAVELLTEFGAGVIITRTSGGSINPVTGVEVAGSVQTFTPKGILKSYPDNLIDGTRITASDRMLIIDASVKPEITDTITVQGEEWPLQEITASNPAGTPLVYFLRVKR